MRSPQDMRCQPVVNLCPNGRGSYYSNSQSLAIGTSRWFGKTGMATGTYTTITNANDTPVGYTSYFRKTWVTVNDGGSTGDTGFEGPFTTWTPISGPYTISYWIRASVSRKTRASMYERPQSGNDIRTYGPQKPCPAGVWTHYTVTMPVQPSLASFRIVPDIVESYGGDGTWQIGSTLDLTGIMLTYGSQPYAYADGDSPNWRWQGAPGASPSIGWPKLTD